MSELAKYTYAGVLVVVVVGREGLLVVSSEVVLCSVVDDHCTRIGLGILRVVVEVRRSHPVVVVAAVGDMVARF